MTRSVALRAAMIVVALTLLAGAASLASPAAALSAVVMVGAALAAVLGLAAAAPTQLAPIPVRVRRRGTR